MSVPTRVGTSVMINQNKLELFTSLYYKAII